jgi:hypothetical protein
MKSRKLGEMLIEARLLTSEQLRQLLTEHKKSGLKLGKYLVKQKILTENQIIDVLSRQMKIEKYHPHKHSVDVTLAQFIPPGIARKHQVAPLKKKGSLLTLAMVDPLDINAMDAIEKLTDHEVEPVVCTESDMNQLIRHIYGTLNTADWSTLVEGTVDSQGTTYAINFICDCGEKTFYPRYASREQSDTLQEENPTFVYLYIELELDESEFCRKCSPEIDKPQLNLRVKWGNIWKTTSGITSRDLYLLAEFATGKMKASDSGSYGELQKRHIPRLVELLGAPLNE